MVIHEMKLLCWILRHRHHSYGLPKAHLCVPCLYSHSVEEANRLRKVLFYSKPKLKLSVFFIFFFSLLLHKEHHCSVGSLQY